MDFIKISQFFSKETYCNTLYIITCVAFEQYVYTIIALMITKIKKIYWAYRIEQNRIEQNRKRVDIK